jgi:hypothetical protein
LEVTVAPLFPDSYVTALQNGKRNLGDAVQAYASRVKTLMSAGRFDLYWIEKEALPWIPAWVELALLTKNVPYVLDYDDAVFHYYDQHSQSIIRWILGDKHAALIQGAALVVAGNSYLAKFAEGAGAKHVEQVPTVIDLDRYPAPTSQSKNESGLLPRIGWIGQRSTADFLMPYGQLFGRMVANNLACFIAIGIDAGALGLPMMSMPWTEQTEVASINSVDIGIMPLVDAPFERGKCGYKLIQYMACGLPVVASPVGINCQIVEHGVNGFLADTPAQWEQALQTLLADTSLRQRMGQAGRLKVEQQYCLQVTGPKLAALLLAAAKA